MAHLSVCILRPDRCIVHRSGRALQCVVGSGLKHLPPNHGGGAHPFPHIALLKGPNAGAHTAKARVRAGLAHQPPADRASADTLFSISVTRPMHRWGPNRDGAVEGNLAHLPPGDGGAGVARNGQQVERAAQAVRQLRLAQAPRSLPPAQAPLQPPVVAHHLRARGTSAC